MDIETSQEDSAYVFRELNFNTSLPSVINSSKTKKNPRKQLEEYYKNIPKAGIHLPHGHSDSVEPGQFVDPGERNL